MIESNLDQLENAWYAATMAMQQAQQDFLIQSDLYYHNPTKPGVVVLMKAAIALNEATNAFYQAAEVLEQYDTQLPADSIK